MMYQVHSVNIGADRIERVSDSGLEDSFIRQKLWRKNNEISAVFNATNSLIS